MPYVNARYENLLSRMNRISGVGASILHDDDNMLIVEENRLSRIAILFMVALFSGGFLYGAFLNGGFTGMLMAIVMSAVIVGIPFLIVYTFSKYRRVEIRDNESIIAILNRSYGRSGTLSLPWLNVTRVECVVTERTTYDSHTNTREKRQDMELLVHAEDGTATRLLRCAYTGDVGDALRRHAGDKYEYTVKVRR